MLDKLHKQFIVWKNWGAYEGWKIEGEAETFLDALLVWREALSYSNFEACVITEYLPLDILDGRLTTSPDTGDNEEKDQA